MFQRLVRDVARLSDNAAIWDAVVFLNRLITAAANRRIVALKSETLSRRVPTQVAGEQAKSIKQNKRK